MSEIEKPEVPELSDLLSGGTTESESSLISDIDTDRSADLSDEIGTDAADAVSGIELELRRPELVGRINESPIAKASADALGLDLDTADITVLIRLANLADNAPAMLSGERKAKADADAREKARRMTAAVWVLGQARADLASVISAAEADLLDKTRIQLDAVVIDDPESGKRSVKVVGYLNSGGKAPVYVDARGRVVTEKQTAKRKRKPNSKPAG